MNAYALVTLKYLNTEGEKSTAVAGTVFADFDPDEFAKWDRKGYARKATVGEVAEAKDNGTYRGPVESDAPGKKSSAKKVVAPSDKKTAAKEQKSEDGAKKGAPNKDDDLA
ncbi:hypothetical protein ABDF71_21940 [Ochrobactrum sp. WV_118_8]